MSILVINDSCLLTLAIILEGPEDPMWFGGRGGFSGIPGSGGP